MEARYCTVEEKVILEKAEGVKGFYLSYFKDGAVSFSMNVNEALKFKTDEEALNMVANIHLAGMEIDLRLRKMITTVEVF